MNFIDELLKGEKVEWKKLEDLIDYEQPTKYIVNSTEYSDEYITPVLTAGQTFILGYTSEKIGIYDANPENPVIIFDDFTTSNHWVDFKFKVKSSALKILKPKNTNVNLRYCYHYIKTINLDITEHKRMWISKYSQIKIAIPLLETQEKIVKILDSYTKYITELQEKLKIELQSRNKQYNYYRDMLLSEDYLNKISEKIYEIEENRTLALVPIKEVCIRQRGFSITAGEMKEIHKDNAPIKIFAGGKTTANIDEYNIDKKYIIKKPSIIVKSRGNIDFEFYDKPFSHKNELWSYSSNDDNILNIKYLYYYLKKNIKYFEDKAISGKLPQISTGITDNYKIWLPSIIIQNKIVKILNRFQELLSDTKGLLPLEIEQRRKQYEYYREKLLTFDSKCGSLPAL